MVIVGANSRVISAACHVRPIGNEARLSNAPYSPFVFKSPWIQDQAVEGQKLIGPASPFEESSPRDTRSMTMSMYRPRAMSDAQLVEPPTPTPLLQAWPLPSPYDARSPRDTRSVTSYRPRATSETQTLEPPTPTPYRQTRPLSSIYNARSAADTKSLVPARSRAASDANTIVPPTPREHDGTSLPSANDTRPESSYRQRATSEARTIIEPPTPPSAEQTRPPSVWGQMKFEPNHQHDQAPPLPTPGLEPPAAPWIDSYKDEKISPLTQTIRLNESRRKLPVSGLSIITPASQPGRRLPWAGNENADSMPTFTPATPYRPQSGITQGGMMIMQEFKNEKEARKARLRLARRKLRWGVVATIVPLGDRSASVQFFPARKESSMGIGHLAFGTVENGVVRPEVGRTYE